MTNVSRIIEQEFRAIVNVTENTAEMMALIAELQLSEKFEVDPKPVKLGPAKVGYRIGIRPQPDGRAPDMDLFPGYVLVASQNLDLVCVYDLATAINLYRDDEADLKWDTAAPTVELGEDGTATLAFRQPTSLTGPFAYIVKRNGTAINVDDPETELARGTVGPFSNIVVGADVKYVVPVAEGDTFTVTVADGFEHTATTAETEPVVLPEPEPQPEPEPEDEPPPA